MKIKKMFENIWKVKSMNPNYKKCDKDTHYDLFLDGYGCALINLEDDVCPECRFPKRISGHIFIKNDEKSLIDAVLLDELRCKTCGHLPDYEITNFKKKEARIIYRNFNNSDEYFKKVKKYLKSKGFKVKK